MFVTLEDFFENYRIKNQQQPNETVLNRGMLQLKRETRELKSIIDILIGNELPTWSSNKIYEYDEYVSYNDLIYKSRQDRNFNNTPFSDDDTWWELNTFDSNNINGSIIKSYSYIATESQTNFVTPFNIEGTPAIFIDGILLSPEEFTIISNIEFQLTIGAEANEKITIISGITYDSSLVIAKQRFVSTENQYIFETEFQIKNPSVFIDGILIDETEYVWSSNRIELNDPIASGKIVIIGNGSVLGSEIYTSQTVDSLLDLKRNISDSYSITDIDSLLAVKTSKTYVDAADSALNLAKANWGSTLSAYGITDAYTKTQINTSLSTKLDTAIFTDAVILQKIKNVDGIGSGLDADRLDGLNSEQFLRTDISDIKYKNLHIINPVDILSDPIVPINEIYFDVESTTPNIFIKQYSNGSLTEEGIVYTNKNTSDMMIIREGYFKGTWEPTLDITFEISNWSNYNWVVIVTPTLTGFEHDYNKDFANGHTPFTGFDNNITWDENQSEYHYGYIQNNIVKMQSVHRNGSSNIDIPARYELIGIKNTFCNKQIVNQI